MMGKFPFMFILGFFVPPGGGAAHACNAGHQQPTTRRFPVHSRVVGPDLKRSFSLQIAQGSRRKCRTSKFGWLQGSATKFSSVLKES
jgi:hypothetical protein